MNRILLVISLLWALFLISISGCSKPQNLTTPAASVIKDSYSRPECFATPFNNGNAQIFTATSTYDISEVDVYLQNWAGASMTGTARMEIHNTATGADYSGNTLDIPGAVIPANGSSTNVFDTSAMAPSGCTQVPFYFSGCPVTAGTKYALVIYWNGAAYNLGINDDLSDHSAPLYNDFVYYGGSYWIASPRIAYIISGN